MSYARNQRQVSEKMNYSRNNLQFAKRAKIVQRSKQGKPYQIQGSKPGPWFSNSGPINKGHSNMPYFNQSNYNGLASSFGARRHSHNG